MMLLTEFGDRTNKADADFLAVGNAIADEYGRFDSRSESNIITLLPKAQKEARIFLKLCADAGKDVRIISGIRTYEEQNALYALGRTETGRIVTNAKGGQSNHNFGIAWDIGIFDDGSYSVNNNEYIALANMILKQMNLIEWDGNWHSIKDYPHYQMKAVSEDVSRIRSLFEKGEVYV